MKNKKNAFTMVELVFVIVVLGILAAVAVPRLAVTRDDAVISKGRSDVSAIRSAIITERQSRLIKGESKYISGTNLNNGGLFAGVLTYSVADSTDSGKWHKVSQSDAKNVYSYKVGSTAVSFTYTRATGKFDCTDSTAKFCAELTH